MLISRVVNRILRDCHKLIDTFKYYYGVSYQPKNIATRSLFAPFSHVKGIDIGYEIDVVKRFYLSHRFDLLGSGWVSYKYHSIPLGCVGFCYDDNLPSYVSKASQLVSFFHKKRALKIEELISKDYQFIDWQRDVKSGYRWNVHLPYFHALKSIGKLEGVDIKVPWELSRLQHLPQLAFFVLNDSLEEQEKVKLEFCNISLDFIASNPTGMGVNWACPMDVAIRVSNLVVAKSLFSNLGYSKGYSAEFEVVFNDNLYQHGEFIFNHLEYNAIYPERNNNHYLSNISGLIFCGAYFPQDSSAKKWLDFAKEELLVCLDNQFYNDGSNFEASTSYHRLSGELIIYPIAVLLNIYGEKWVSSYLGPERVTKIYKIGLFTQTITKPDGSIPQIGDNDSGRFFKIDLSGELITNKKAVAKYLNLEGYLNHYEESEQHWDQNCLNHSSFVNACDSLFGIGEVESLEARLIMMLSGGRKLDIPIVPDIPTLSEVGLPELIDSTYEFPSVLIYKSEIPLDELKITHFTNFGLTILTCGNHFYCSIYTGGVGQAGNGGHAHADFGSYDLIINGKDIAKDPGTYLYTPSQAWRNAFRAKYHNGFVKDRYHFNSEFSSQINVTKLNLSIVGGDVFMEAFDDCKLISIKRNDVIIKTSKETEDLSVEFYSPGYGKLMK